MPVGTAPLQDQEARRRNRRTALIWGGMFGGLFIATFVANGLLTTMSLGTWTGLVSDHAYDEGLSYNKTLDAAKEMAARGWRVGIDFTSGVGQAGDLAVTVKDHDGKSLTGADVTATFYRPTSEGHDVPVTLSDADGDGRYTAHTALPLTGVYDVHVVVRHPAGEYQKTKRVWVK